VRKKKAKKRDKEESERRRERGRKEKEEVDFFYQGVVKPHTNDSTFLPGGGSPGINVRPSHLYRTDPPKSTNVRYLYQVSWIKPRRASVRGHLYRPVAPTGTNAITCTGGNNIRYK
jgi:hypothetical protein